MAPTSAGGCSRASESLLVNSWHSGFPLQLLEESVNESLRRMEGSVPTLGQKYDQADGQVAMTGQF